MARVEELASLSREALKQHWRTSLGSDPAPRLRNATMVRILTCEHQWETSGENRAAIIRKLRKLADTTGTPSKQLNPGSRLVREWNGAEHTVDVTDNGYVWRGKTWRSLSLLAKEITGTKWSGPRFFGVKA
ncbi:MAG: DUF2924 domain-containing protein [Pseudomonadota bacterium]